VLLSFDIFFTFLVVIVPASISVRRLLGKCNEKLDVETLPEKNCGSLLKLCVEPLLIVFTCLLLAVFIPDVGDLTGLATSLGATFSGLVAPLILYMSQRDFNDRSPTNIALLLFHFALMIFACLAGGYTFYSSVAGTVSAYKSGIHLFSNNCSAIYCVSNRTNYIHWNCSY